MTAPTLFSRERPYTQLLRGDRHRWWRSLLSTVIVLGGLALALGLVTVVFFVGILLDPQVDLVGLDDPDALGPLLERWWVFLANNLVLALGIPLAILAVWAGHRWGPGWAFSVEGRLRWRWLGQASLVCLLVTVVFIGGSFVLDPSPIAPSPDAALLLVVVLLTTPFQAAGEELAFRGWLSQALGSLFARALVGAVVAGAVSATLFAMAHGAQGPWLFADRFAFGVVASLLVWRTGGLEASIAVHALNNMVIFVPTVLTGALADALTVSDTTWQSFAINVAMLSVLAVVLDLLARRRGLRRTTTLGAPPVRGEQPLTIR